MPLQACHSCSSSTLWRGSCTRTSRLRRGLCLCNSLRRRRSSAACSQKNHVLGGNALPVLIAISCGPVTRRKSCLGADEVECRCQAQHYARHGLIAKWKRSRYVCSGRPIRVLDAACCCARKLARWEVREAKRVYIRDPVAGCNVRRSVLIRQVADLAHLGQHAIPVS